MVMRNICVLYEVQVHDKTSVLSEIQGVFGREREILGNTVNGRKRTIVALKFPGDCASS